MFQYITRITEFDAAHRIMNEKVKCFNNHGHRFIVYLTFRFEKQESLGYAIDFKEIKRVGCQWIDDYLDHAAIYNPLDEDFIEPCKKHNTKLWIMGLNGEGEYCNPSVENIAQEIYLAMDTLFEEYPIWIDRVKVYETPNCYTEYSEIEYNHRLNWRKAHYEEVRKYAKEKGIKEYDDRKGE